MDDERAEMKELSKGLAEAVKLAVDQGCALLCCWLDSQCTEARFPDQAEQTFASVSTGGLLTIVEVAKRLDVSERTIRDLIRQDGFPDRRIGKAQRFDWAEVEAWTKRHRDKLEKKR
jgi:excisionase family DNA binding protein